MSFITKIIIVMVIIGLGIAAALIRSSGKREQKPTRSDPKPVETHDPEEDKKLWRELYSKAQRLEQEMVILTGGKTGMVVQKDRYQSEPGALAAEEYRENFMIKQKRLKQVYEEYCSLKKSIDRLPESAGERLPLLRDEALYVELINTKL